MDLLLSLRPDLGYFGYSLPFEAIASARLREIAALAIREADALDARDIGDGDIPRPEKPNARKAKEAREVAGKDRALEDRPGDAVVGEGDHP